MPSPSAAAVKLVRVYKPVLVYWHCDCYWELEEGPVCSMEHDDGQQHNGRKRHVWICEESEEKTCYLTQAAFAEHLRELCHDA